MFNQHKLRYLSILSIHCFLYYFIIIAIDIDYNNIDYY